MNEMNPPDATGTGAMIGGSDIEHPELLSQDSEGAQPAVVQPAKVLRIGSMVKLIPVVNSVVARRS